MNLDDEFAAAGAGPAKLYRAKGMQIVPAYIPGEQPKGLSWKRPRLNEWVEYQEALIPDDLFNSWYGPGGAFVSRENMGMICGRASDNLFVIDLDLYKKLGAAEWWSKLMLVHNNSMELETVEQITGGGGRQKIFRAPPGWVVPNKAIHSIGVDIKGQGGFVMLAPSLHESGRHYVWVDGQSPEDIEPTTAPDWLLEAVEALVAEHGGNSGTHSHANGHDPQPAYDGFGHQVDGREVYMRDMVWAAVLNWNAECPLPVSPEMSLERARKEYEVYEREVSPQGAYPADVSKAEALDRESRGWKTFHVKWQAAMRKWDGDVYREARRPGRIKPDATFRDENVAREEQIKIDPATGQPLPLILTSAEFLAGYTPPAYLIDEVIQRGYLYSLTARTGHGKTAIALYMAQAIARGKEMHGHRTLSGTVLILAGENPDDVRARFFVLGHAYNFNPAQAKIRWIPGVKHLPSHMDIIRKETDEIDDLVLVLVDTAAAYFPGTETNSNSEQGEYARLLRQMTFLKNKPAVIALSHPVKNASKDNLLPMGGSAFLNEVDGNLTLWAGVERQTTLHWQGKFRGPEFDPMTFELLEEHCSAVKNEDGELLPSVVAKPMAEAAVEAAEDMAEAEEDKLMRAMYGAQAASFGKLADKLGWKKWKVQRLMERLSGGKFVEQKRNKKYMLTDKGVEAIGGLKKGRHHD